MELRSFGVGNATRDCEVKTVGKSSLCENSLAFNRSYKTGDEWNEEVTYIKVKVWGPKGEKFASSVSKGTPVFVDGYLSQESWEDKEGQKRSAIVMIVNNFSVCEKNGKTKTSNNESTSVAEPPKNQKKSNKKESKQLETVASETSKSEEVPF